VPTEVGVYDVRHEAWFVPDEDRVHMGGLKLPDPLVERVTWPVGSVAPVVAVSVTVAVHVVDLPIVTGEIHDTAVLVGFTVTPWVTLAPRTFSGRVFPSASATRTHIFAGDAILLGEHPAPSAG
jgi:hypothetical protein